jgi:catechol 2,3-dioxygenase-like lactoylglutathione lyase family enzyme
MEASEPKGPAFTAPVRTRGLRHVALRVRELERTQAFYCEVFGMRLVWQPDPDNSYLSSGSDNLALHRVDEPALHAPPQVLDHIGFFVDAPEDVRRAADRLREHGVRIVHEPRRHRDGSWSLYCEDPDGNVVQVLYDPNANP